jgi:hypothetical protein
MTDDFSFLPQRRGRKKQESFRILCQGGEICLIFGHKSSISSRNFFFLPSPIAFPSVSLREALNLRQLPRETCRCERGKISSSLKVRLCEEDEEEGRKKMLRKRNAFPAQTSHCRVVFAVRLRLHLQLGFIRWETDEDREKHGDSDGGKNPRANFLSSYRFFIFLMGKNKTNK